MWVNTLTQFGMGCTSPRASSSSFVCVPEGVVSGIRVSPLASSLSVVRQMRKPDSVLYDRGLELRFLKKFVETPGGFLLLTGPPDCGKTEILKQLAFQEAAVTWIDLRGGEFTTAEKFTKHLGQELGDLSLLDNLQVKFEWKKVSLELNKKDTIGFHTTMWNYLKRRKAETTTVPTVILDEANALQCWQSDETSQKALLSFLNFFVKISKQDHLANVIMATSDYYFRYWLEDRIGASRVLKQAIGDFTEEDARGFLNFKLGYHCSDAMWEEVYKMCGGRAYLLEKVAVYSDADDWADYLEDLKDNAAQDVYKGMEPENLSLKDIPPCWDRDAYLQVIKALCDCQDGVMAWKDFVSLPFCSTKIARALICYNLLHCRFKSRLAQDLRWYKGSWPVVMPLSQVHLTAMKDLVACWSD